MSSIYEWKRPLTTAELLEIAENLDEIDIIPDGIIITPPDDYGDNTDCDSGEEENDNPNNLNHNQLNAEADFFYENNEVLTESSSDEEDNLPLAVFAKRHKLMYQKCTWTKGDLHDIPQEELFEFLPPLTLASGSHPIDFFSLMLTPEIIQKIVDFTNVYAAQKNKQNFDLSSEELNVFIGILLLSGYVPLPRRRMYWEESEDVHNKLVSQSMRRNRFEEIASCLHLADNQNLPNNDKVGKVRPLIEFLNKQFLKYAPIETNVSIDESMIPYFGRHGCKQFMKGKPIRFGYKAWVAALRTGYCLQFEIYQGRKDKGENRGLGLGESVVLNFADILYQYFSQRFSFYFDNFFTSAKLIRALSAKQFGATGTVRETRMEKCKLKDSKTMKTQDRGSMDCAIDKNNHIVGIRWKDNSIVTILSNQYGMNPIQKCSRYSARDKKKIEINQPNVIKYYNRYMGGVDQLDNHVSNYRIALRGKKWYTPLVYWMIDVCATNAYLLARKYGCRKDNLEFRRDIARVLLVKYGQKSAAPGRKKSFIRYPMLAFGRHIIVTQQNRRRCELCKNKTTKACEACDVPLHDKCFFDYHNQ